MCEKGQFLVEEILIKIFWLVCVSSIFEDIQAKEAILLIRKKGKQV
jgi:hypothetical protein